MARTCRNICLRYKAKPVSNKIRYNLGHKRCTFCEVFLLQEGVRCVCCRAVLRTNSRNKKNRT